MFKRILILAGLMVASATAYAAPKPTIIPIPAGAACTPDLNIAGFPSGCECPELYKYNESIFKCELAVKSAPTFCTADINRWGNSSACGCVSDVYSYDEVVGQCILQLHAKAGRCTRDINPWGHASNCSCPTGYSYDEKTGTCDLT